MTRLCLVAFLALVPGIAQAQYVLSSPTVTSIPQQGSVALATQFFEPEDIGLTGFIPIGAFAMSVELGGVVGFGAGRLDPACRPQPQCGRGKKCKRLAQRA